MNPFDAMRVGHNLIVAASDGDAEGVRRALAAGASPSAADELANSALHVGGRHPDVVRVLVEAGGSLTAQDSDGETPLHRAAGTGPWASVAAMIAGGGDWRAAGGPGRFGFPLPRDEEPHFLEGTPLGIALAGSKMEATLHSSMHSPDVVKREREYIEGRVDVVNGWLTAHPDAEGVGTEDLYRAMLERHGGHREPNGPAALVPVLTRHGHRPEAWPFLLEAAMRSAPLLQALLDAGLEVREPKAGQVLEMLATHGSSPTRVEAMAEMLMAHGARWTPQALEALNKRWEPKGTGTVTGAAHLLAWAHAQAQAQMFDEAVPPAPSPGRLRF